MTIPKKLFKRWSFNETEMLIELYPNTSNSELARIFKTTVSVIKNTARKCGLTKADAYMADPANRGRFLKGVVPKNKGKKMPEHVRAVASRTMFRTGHTPANTKSDGVITIRHSHKARNNRPYKWIRISKGKWKMLHVHVWEETHGAVPHGYIIVFKDKDSMNCTLANLEMISRSENAKRNYNYEKCKATLSKLPDKYVAGRLSQNDKATRKKLLQQPELLELARQSMLLKRTIKQRK